MVNTRQLQQSDVDLMTAEQRGIFLPAFYAGVVVTFTLPSPIVANYSKWNALTDTRGGLPQLLPLAIDLETVAGIFAGQITQWTDPAILATAPQVGNWFAAHPQVSTAFTPVVCCSNTQDQQSAGVLLLQALNQTKVAQAEASQKYFKLPISWTEQMRVSSAFDLADIEARMSSRATSNQLLRSQSTISYRMISGVTTDPASEFQIVQTVASQVETVLPQPSAFTACVQEGWKTQQLTNPQWLPGPISGCYPLSSPLSFGVGLAFEGTACTRGNHSLNYFQWINTNAALSAAAQSSGVLRVSDLSEIQAYITTTLNTATCDGETLLITLPKVWTLNSAITGFGIAVMVMLLVTFVASFVILAIYRHRTVLRSSSVPFLALTLFGLSLLAISISLWSSPTVTSASCASFMWLASLGFSLVFVPFFAKTWRIYLIFSRKKLQVIKMSNKRLFALVAAFFAAEMIVMIAWSNVAPLKPVTYYRNISGTIHQATHCSVEGQGMAFVIVEAVYKGLLLLVGSLLAFRTRKVSSSFNESSSIAMSIYSCLFSALIIGALIYFVSAFEDTLILLMLFLIFWLATVTWALVFGAKFYALFSQSETEAAQASKIDSLQTEKSQGGFSFVSVITMPIPMLKTYVQALESQLYKAKKQLTAALGAGGSIGGDAAAGQKGTGPVSEKRSLRINPPMGNKSRDYGIPGETNGHTYLHSPSASMDFGEEPDVLLIAHAPKAPAQEHGQAGVLKQDMSPPRARIYSGARSPSLSRAASQPSVFTLSTSASASAPSTTVAVSPTIVSSLAPMTGGSQLHDTTTVGEAKLHPRPPASANTTTAEDSDSVELFASSGNIVLLPFSPIPSSSSSPPASPSSSQRVIPPGLQSAACKPSSRAQVQVNAGTLAPRQHIRSQSIPTNE